MKNDHSVFILFGILGFVAWMVWAVMTRSPDALSTPAPAPPTDAEKAGRQAFIELKCTSCHRVLGDPKLPAPVASQPAPVLGGLNAVHTREELMAAIARPSHSFAPGFHPAPGDGSPMGDMRDSMTLAQAQNIVTYLRGQEESDSGWPKEGER